MYSGNRLIYLLWLLFLTSKVSTLDHPIFLLRLTRQTYYGAQPTSLYPNYQSQPQTLNNPGQQWNGIPYQYRQQEHPRYPNNVLYGNSSQQNSYPKFNTTKVLTRNATGPQWQSTGASSINLYLKSQTPPPGLGPGMVYYQAPPNQQPHLNRTGEHWNSTLGQSSGASYTNQYLKSQTPPPPGPGLVYYQVPPNYQPQMNRSVGRWNSTSGQYSQVRFARAAHQSRHQNLSWYNIHPNWYDNKPPAWNGTGSSWNQPGGQYFQWNMSDLYQNWHNNKPPVWNGTGPRWNNCGSYNFQWNMTDSNNSTASGPCTDNPSWHDHHHRHHKHRHHHHHHHHEDSQPPPPPTPPLGPPPQFGQPNFNRPPPGWYPFSTRNSTLSESNGTVTPGTYPWDTEVVTGTTLGSTQENDVVKNNTEVSVNSTNGVTPAGTYPLDTEVGTDTTLGSTQENDVVKNNTEVSVNSTNGVTPAGTYPLDTEVGTDTTFGSTQEDDVVKNNTDVSVNSTYGKGNGTTLWGIEARDLDGLAVESNRNNTPQPE